MLQNIALYHPLTNDDAECFVQTLKCGGKERYGDAKSEINEIFDAILKYYISCYEGSISSTTFFMKRQVQLCLDIMNETAISAKGMP